MINQIELFKYVKDHLDYFGFYPNNFEDTETNEVVTYPTYMRLFTKQQINSLRVIFNKHDKYTK